MDSACNSDSIHIYIVLFKVYFCSNGTYRFEVQFCSTGQAQLKGYLNMAFPELKENYWTDFNSFFIVGFRIKFWVDLCLNISPVDTFRFILYFIKAIDLNIFHAVWRWCLVNDRQLSSGLTGRLLENILCSLFSLFWESFIVSGRWFF